MIALLLLRIGHTDISTPWWWIVIPFLALCFAAWED